MQTHQLVLLYRVLIIWFKVYFYFSYLKEIAKYRTHDLYKNNDSKRNL